jgi:hypothetical protein
MSAKQKIVIVAVIIIALMGVFPPWRVSFDREGERGDVLAGYAFISAGPADINHAIIREKDIGDSREWLIDALNDHYRIRVRIDIVRLLVQWVIVAVLAWGIAYAIEPRRTPRPSP